MVIDYSIQKLFPIKRLNGLKQLPHRDVLYLRVDKKYFLEYHAWSDFGDISANEMLIDIKVKKKLPPFLEELLLLEKSKEKIQHYPLKNNILYSEDIDIRNTNNSTPIKYKFNSNYEEISKLLSFGKIIRIDFNGLNNSDELLNWLRSRSTAEIELIDYIEDPVLNPTDALIAQELGVKIARDRLPLEGVAVDRIILKPNVDLGKKFQTSKCIISSYMGGDLGRYHCYLFYCLNGNKDYYHGINTPNIYKDQLTLFNSSCDGLVPHLPHLKKIYKLLEGFAWKSLF